MLCLSYDPVLIMRMINYISLSQQLLKMPLFDWMFTSKQTHTEMWSTCFRHSTNLNEQDKVTAFFFPETEVIVHEKRKSAHIKMKLHEISLYQNKQEAENKATCKYNKKLQLQKWIGLVYIRRTTSLSSCFENVEIHY